jgi:hypothetical protein
LNGCVPVTLTVYVCEATYVAGNVTDHAVDRGAAVHIDVDAKYDGGPTLHADAAAPLEYEQTPGSTPRNTATNGSSMEKDTRSKWIRFSKLHGGHSLNAAIITHSKKRLP